MMLEFSDFSICLLSIILFLFFLLKVKIRKKNEVFIVISVFLLSFVAFFYNPIKAWLENGDYTDLYRFYMDIDSFVTYGWNGLAIHFLTEYEVMPVTKILIYIISLTGIKNILPALSALLTYGIMGIVLYKADKANKSLSDNNMAFFFFVFIALVNFKITITNIRMPIGMSLFFYILYKDLEDDTNFIKCLVGYISCCCIHSVFVLFLLFRLFLIIFNKYSSKILYLIIVISGLFVSYIPNMLEKYRANEFINNIVYKIGYYTTGGGSNYIEYPVIFLGILKILMLIYLLTYIKKIVNKSNKNKSMYQITNLFLLFSIGSIWNFHLFHRMTNFLIYFIVYWGLILCSKENNILKKNFNNIGVHNGIISVYSVIWFAFIMIHLSYFFLSYQYSVLVF